MLNLPFVYILVKPVVMGCINVWEMCSIYNHLLIDLIFIHLNHKRGVEINDAFPEFSCSLVNVHTCYFQAVFKVLWHCVFDILEVGPFQIQSIGLFGHVLCFSSWSRLTLRMVKFHNVNSKMSKSSLKKIYIYKLKKSQMFGLSCDVII